VAAKVAYRIAAAIFSSAMMAQSAAAKNRVRPQWEQLGMQPV